MKFFDVEDLLNLNFWACQNLEFDVVFEAIERER